MASKLFKLIHGYAERLRRAGADTIRTTAEQSGMRTMRRHGLELVDVGVTTLDEVLRASDYA